MVNAEVGVGIGNGKGEECDDQIVKYRKVIGCSLDVSS